MAKVKLDTRLEMEVFRRLQTIRSQQKISISDVIANALNAQEREQNVAETVGERLDFLERNLLALVELMEVFDRKIDRHFIESGASEKERLGALYRLL
jgi:predicted CopG family antitoxin